MLSLINSKHLIFIRNGDCYRSLAIYISLCNTLCTQFQFDSSLSFKLDVLTTSAPTTERNIDHEFLSAFLILLYVLITYTL